jgi:hypothetical protein
MIIGPERNDVCSSEGDRPTHHVPSRLINKRGPGHRYQNRAETARDAKPSIGIDGHDDLQIFLSYCFVYVCIRFCRLQYWLNLMLGICFTLFHRFCPELLDHVAHPPVIA